ncbi:unnamed protein product [Ascophyllum nodosum]
MAKYYSAWLGRQALVVVVLQCLVDLLAVNAACPNYCSGHGTCGSGATCSCNSGWDYAPDCSLRECSKGYAWADKAYATDAAHSEVECSNAGICNRETGVCECFTPFTGAACQRVRCPGDCSGHGTCMTIADMSRFYGPDYAHPGTGGDGMGPEYSNWDAQSTTACFCDQGYFGADCSNRMCPKDDDPVSIDQNDRAILVSVGTDFGGLLEGSLTFTFNGHSTVIDTNIFSNVLADALCEEAFERLGNVNDVKCGTTPLTNGGMQMNISLVSFPLMPAENNIFYHTGNPDLSAFTCDVSEAYPAGLVDCNITDVQSTNIKEYEFCARRGICEFEMGLCECLDGWTGAACSIRSYVYSASNALPGISLQVSGLNYSGNVFEAVTEKRSAADFNFIQCQAENTVVFEVRGDGHITFAELTVTEGPLTVKDGGLDIGGGGMAVQGGATISTPWTSVDTLALTSMSPGYIGNILSTSASTIDSTAFNHIQAWHDSAAAFTVRGDGDTTIGGGDFTVTMGDANITAGDLYLLNGSISALNGKLSIAGIISSEVVEVETDIVSHGDIIASTGLLTIQGITSSDTVTVTSGGADITGGLEVISGGATITAGGVTIISGGETIDAGDLTVATGDVTISVGDLTITAGNLDVAAGNITATAGSLMSVGVSSSADITITSGDLAVNSGAITASGIITSAGVSSSAVVSVNAGGIYVRGGVIISTGSLDVQAGAIAARGRVTSGGVSSSAVITAAGVSSSTVVTVTSGGIHVTDGATISTGDLDVSTGAITSNGTVTSAGVNSSSAVTVSSGGIDVTGGAVISTGDLNVSAGAISASGTVSSAGVNSSAVITTAGMSSSAVVIVTAGGIDVTGGAVISSGDLNVSAGAITANGTVTSVGMSSSAVITAAGVTSSSTINVTAGGLYVTGGATILTGDLDVPAGNITSSGIITSVGVNSSAVVTVTAGGINVTGGVVITTGDLNVSTGAIIANGTVTSAGVSSSAAVSVTAGGINVTGGATITTGNLTVSAGSITASGVLISAGMNSSADVTITGNIEISGTSTALSHINSSDRRLKESIAPLSNPLRTIARVRGVSFKWKEGVPGRQGASSDSEREIGFIAQEVQDALPELVHRSGGTVEGFLALNYAGFVPLVVEGVKELHGIISRHQREVNERFGTMDSVTSRYQRGIEERCRDGEARLRALEDAVRSLQEAYKASDREKRVAEQERQR